MFPAGILIDDANSLTAALRSGLDGSLRRAALLPSRLCS